MSIFPQTYQLRHEADEPYQEDGFRDSLRERIHLAKHIFEVEEASPEEEWCILLRVPQSDIDTAKTNLLNRGCLAQIEGDSEACLRCQTTSPQLFIDCGQISANLIDGYLVYIRDLIGDCFDRPRYVYGNEVVHSQKQKSLGAANVPKVYWVDNEGVLATSIQNGYCGQLQTAFRCGFRGSSAGMRFLKACHRVTQIAPTLKKARYFTPQTWGISSVLRRK